MAEKAKQSRLGAWLGVLIVGLFVLIPYGYAAIAGVAEAEATGLGRITSAARSVYCESGLTPFGVIMGALLLVMLGLVVAANALGERLPASRFLRSNGWHLLAAMVLITLPFFIAWQTDSSVCSRGRAFFWESVLIDVFILAILAASYNLIFGFSGILSFGHAAFFGMGAYTVGIVMQQLGFAWWLGILSALLVGVIIALIMGFVGLRIKGLYFALFTLAFAEILYILAGNRVLVEITGAEDGFTFDVPDFLNITQNRLFFYYLALAVLVLTFLLIRWLMNSPTGRVLHAVRENEERAQMLGYNTFHFKLLAIVASGVLAASAGVLRGLALKGASPNVLSLDFTITPLLMVIIGGMATFAGPIVGAFGLRLTEQFLRDTVITLGSVEINIGERWALILGVIFILSVMVFPQGIVGTWYSRGLNTRAGWERLFRRSKTPDEQVRPAVDS